jgi:hypothetical protein
MRLGEIREQGINDIEIIPSSIEGKILCLQSMMEEYFKQNDIEIIYYQRFKFKHPMSILCKYLRFPELTIGVSKLKRFRCERREKDEKHFDDYISSILNCFRRLG